MKLEDALFNWLQIRIAADGRPDDQAAQQTADFFLSILRDDHGITDIRVVPKGDDLIQVFYERNGESGKKTFDRRFAEQLLLDIEANPKFNE
jgi:hypothetical protein